MKIVFENAITENISCKLTAEIITNNLLSITIKNSDYRTKSDKEASHYLTQQDLSKLIGSLLHLQSSLKRSK
jgi:hypothetical protein